jgi:hypothetical protein
MSDGRRDFAGGKEWTTPIISDKGVPIKSEETENVKMTSIREYSEGLPVTIEEYVVTERKSLQLQGRAKVGERRITIVASCQAGFDGTQVDLLDLLQWVKENKPELLK